MAHSWSNSKIYASPRGQGQRISQAAEQFSQQKIHTIFQEHNILNIVFVDDIVVSLTIWLSFLKQIEFLKFLTFFWFAHKSQLKSVRFFFILFSHPFMWPKSSCAKIWTYSRVMFDVHGQIFCRWLAAIVHSRIWSSNKFSFRSSSTRLF